MRGALMMLISGGAVAALELGGASAAVDMGKQLFDAQRYELSLICNPNAQPSAGTLALLKGVAGDDPAMMRMLAEQQSRAGRPLTNFQRQVQASMPRTCALADEE